jgi:hypothetical protein
MPREITELLLDREFLKKAATLFASEHNAPTPARREEHVTTQWNSVLRWCWLRRSPCVPVGVADLRLSRCHIHEVATGRQVAPVPIYRLVRRRGELADLRGDVPATVAVEFAWLARRVDDEADIAEFLGARSSERRASCRTTSVVPPAASSRGQSTSPAAPTAASVKTAAGVE